ncbi:MAG: hypothetical protein AAFV25_04945 [Bacteroidota bacterium]
MNSYHLRKGLKPEMKGRFAERPEGGKWRFWELHILPYDPRQRERLVAMDCLEESILGEYLRLLNTPISPGTRYLYKLKTYLGETGQEDRWTFNEQITAYESFGFQRLEELLQFCRDTWGIDESNFKQQSDTHIPQ